MTVLRLRTDLALLLLVAIIAACTSTEGRDGGSVGTGQATADRTDLASESDAAESDTGPEAPAIDPSGPDGDPGEDADTDSTYPDEAELADLPFEEACRFAGEEEGWCADSNGNGWPDLVEEATGRDPNVDACAQGDCEAGNLETFLAGLQANTLLVLDASGSMAGDAGGGLSKMEAAKDALVRYVRSTPEFADLGLVVYGHRGDNSDAGRTESCAGVETFAEVGALTADDVEQVVAGFAATGWTPIAGALDAAGPILQEAAEADAAEGLEAVPSRVIVISDGIETCGGDPVASARALTELGIEVVVDVVGFDIEQADRAALEEVAAVTGGRYYEASDGRALREVLAAYNRQVLEATQPLRCQRQALRQYVMCGRLLDRDALMWLRTTARDLEDRDRAAFLSAWGSALSEGAGVRSAERRAALTATIDELLAQLEEARRLADEAYGDQSSQEVSRVPTRWVCPWV